MFNRIVTIWKAISNHMVLHRAAKLEAKKIRDFQIKTDIEFKQAMQSLPKALDGIQKMKEVYYRKGVFLSEFASVEERADARIGGIRKVEDIESIEDEVKRYRAKVSQISMVSALNTYCLQMWQINARNNAAIQKPV